MILETYVRFRASHQEKAFVELCAKKHDLSVSQYLRYLIDQDANDAVIVMSDKMRKARGVAK